MSTLHEECGVFGLCVDGMEHAAGCVYNALYALQQRGQESAGIAINDGGVITSHKDVGLVSEVFTPEVLEHLGNGSMAVGHVRYATTGRKSRSNAQPMVINHVKGTMALYHNGNLTNAAELREKLELSGAIFHTTSDTEVIAYTITGARLKTPSIEAAVSAAMDIIQGAYSLVLLSPRKLIAARDPNGFRPLCIGTLEGGYVFASESCALDAIGARFLRDVEPGEIVVADKDGLRSIKDHCGKAKSSLCVFEFIYFARPDSVIDGAGVHEARLRAGAFLALEHPVQADIVIGVPDSGIDAAIGYARQSGILYGTGFIKNKYIARTFIAPGQKNREDKVRIKLNPISSVVRGKRVVIVDDSIVRGTTSARIVSLLREAGATEVHMRISAPPFLHPCYFGTDIDSRDHLIACNHSVEEITKIIGADSLGYLSVENVHKLANGCRCTFCDGCFTGHYPVPVPEAREKFRFERKLSQT
ncbi:amidophosphoribosyltransferase [Intestinimonas timonensis]|uniref:amidophosphoribosyltransferase n=1 Tax=Intestinimonas timonensis TaxID=1689270 RepID=UPI0010302695|nr:amidophosphoribosyltransferase [Intestinimonas timonensis]